MANRKSVFCNNQIYHVYNRGVDKRAIFLDDSDYYRFIHCLYEFNDKEPALPHKIRIGGRTSDDKKRDLLVDILCYCLIPNHFHLILKQLQDNGITRFMRKLSTGYAMYFNEKYERSGTLFQGRFKDVLVESDEQLIHLSRYIHLNPLNVTRNGKKIIKIDDLKKFRFSSYLDYIGKNNFPSAINTEMILGLMDKNSYKDFIANFANEEEELMGLKLE